MQVNFIKRFESALREKVELRVSNRDAAVKHLVQNFQFFDLDNSGTCGYESFRRVVHKMGVFGFSEGDLVQIFGIYSMSARRMNYKEYVNVLFGITPSKRTQGRSIMTRTDRSRKLEWDSIKGFVDSIKYKLCQMKMYSFLKLRVELEEASPVDRATFQEICKKNGISLSENDFKKLFQFFKSENKFLDIETFSDTLCVNFRKDRGEKVDKMFNQLDNQGYKLISINLLDSLFIPRQHYLVKKGRRTQEEAKEEWIDSLDMFKKLTKSVEVDLGQFRLFWKLMSGYIKNELDFSNLLIQCFRFSDLSKLSSSTKGKALTSMSSNYKIDLEHKVRIQIADKGNVGCFILLKNLQSRDHDMDGKVDRKEFMNALVQSRIEMSPRNIEELFSLFAQNGLLKIWEFLSVIVVKFQNEREQALIKLFDQLGPDRHSKKLKLSKIESTFFPRGHPDFKRLYRADYEIKQEFNSNLRQFLNSFQGSALELGLNGFLRFFEFYCFGLDDSGFFSLMEKGFKFPDNNRQFMDKKSYINPYGDQRDQREVQSRQRTSSHLSVSKRSAANRPARSIRTNNRSQRHQTDYSPHSVSVISRRTEYPEQIQSFNSKLEKANFQKKQIVGQKQSRYWEHLMLNIKSFKNFSLLLELEYEMTKRADEKGNVDFDVFQSVLEESGVTYKLTEEQLRAIFLEGLQFGNLFVQGFINDLRGQITEDREYWTIDLFDKIRNPATDTIKLATFRRMFKEKPFKWNSSSDEDNQENFQYMLDLFNYLNLAIKKTDEIDLDDFLYLFDNFSFFIDDNQDYRYFLDMCF
jgi:Ca2+-binding EF-hand superfamily protein